MSLRAATVRWGFTLAIALALAGAVRAPAATPPIALDEKMLNKVVALYLVNFAHYVRWPDSAPPDGQPLTIAILGRDPLGETLDRTLAGKTAAGHPLRALRTRCVEDLDGCQIVFLDRPTRALAVEVAAALAGKPVLVVAFEAEGGSGRAMVDLLLQKDETVRYQLDVGALQSAGLTPSPSLLQLALPAKKTRGRTEAPRP